MTEKARRTVSLDAALVKEGLLKDINFSKAAEDGLKLMLGINKDTIEQMKEKQQRLQNEINLLQMKIDERIEQSNKEEQERQKRIVRRWD